MAGRYGSDAETPALSVAETTAQATLGLTTVLVIGQFTAYKAEQILVNKVPSNKIPVETLTRFALQVRMDVAEQLKRQGRVVRGRADLPIRRRTP